MRKSTIILLAAALLPAVAQARGDIENVPGVSDGPALAPYVEQQLVQGFADRSSARAAGSGGDGAVTFSEQTPDGRSLPLSIDPISGEILTK
ncbi:hypothetical protein [Solimonas soli]|uniref:hypothetical protein n=1 Tax=Solimonas soli TaxID=413479 RepID=UPI00048045F3|nr:hypothetical protein [Solimonas soli]